MSVSQTVKDFVTLAIQSGGWMEMDRLYLENRVIAMIGENSLSKAENRIVSESAVELVDQLLVQAEKNQVIKDLQAERDMLEAQLMDCCKCLFRSVLFKGSCPSDRLFLQVKQRQ